MIRREGSSVRCVAVFVLGAAGVAAAGSLPSGWDSGVSAYDAALKKAAAGGKPMLLYFHTDRCPYCQETERDYLCQRDVQNYLNRFVKVEIDVDRGEDSEALQRKMNVRGYPSLLLLVPAFNTKPAVVNPLAGSEKPTPEVFIQQLQLQVNMSCMSVSDSLSAVGNWEKAIEVYRLEVQFGFPCADPHLKMGYCYEQMAGPSRDRRALCDAEDCYERALDASSGNAQAKEGLARVRAALRAPQGQTAAGFPQAPSPGVSPAAPPAPPAPQRLLDTGQDATQNSGIREFRDKSGVVTLTDR